MNLPFYIARRYLFAKKSHNAINIISTVSVCGVVVATVAMVCTLSVYNGFKGLTTTLFSIFDPELKITSAAGKVFTPEGEAFTAVKALPDVALYSCSLEENALVRYGDRQEVAILKGVDTVFQRIADIDTAIIDGEFRLEEGDTRYGVLGIGLSYALGVNAAFAHPIELFMPKRNETVNLANPAASAHVEYVYIGGIYRINQTVYDEGFMLVPLHLLREMLDYENEVSAIEIKTAVGANIETVKKKICSLLGNDYIVQDRFEQQQATFKMVQIEKWVTFLMLCFILIMSLFNVLGSLAILMIEKEEDILKLRSLGADNNLINRIFLFEGWMISLFGAVLGVLIGLGLCFVQQRYGLIALGSAAGAFIVDAYPVEVEWSDVIVIFLTVVSTGLLAAFYPVHFLGRKWLRNAAPSSALFLLLLFTASCSSSGGGSKNASAQKPEIAVTVEPLRFFAEKIAPDDYRFFAVVPAGQGPETYDPTPRDLIRFSKATAFMQLNVLPAEQNLSTIALSNAVKVVNLSAGIHLHSHNVGDVQHIDPHVWTSFTGAKIIAANIFNALTQLNPEHADVYKTNYINLLSELQELEDTLRLQLDAMTCRSFVIYHPALTYFADEFGLKQLAVEEDGKEPSTAALTRLVQQAKHDSVKVIFVQKEFDARYANRLAVETNASIKSLNALDYRWDECMRETVNALLGDE